MKKCFYLFMFTALVLVSGAFAQDAQPQGAPSAAQSETNPAPDVLIDPGVIYNDKHPGNWVGKSVTLQNVMVQDTNDSGNFWVGQDGSHRLLIVKADNDPNMKALHVKKGDIVTVSGTVQPASRYAADQTSAEKGSMHDAEKSSGVYLQANDLSVRSSTRH
ncbi:MAG TPA: hypothetical protein VFA68_10425 [Terriglobales bacterium]|nr:hypothetical protein [Terriglobales bacterium]